MRPSIADDRLRDEAEAATLLGLKKQTMAAWRHRGCGPRYVKIGKLVRYRLSDLTAYVDSRTCSNTGEAAALD